MDEYQLWGNRWADITDIKRDFLRKEYDNKLQNILAGLLESEQMSKRLEQIVKKISENSIAEQIVLTSFINGILNLNITLHDIIYLLDQVAISARISMDTDIRELIDIRQNCINLQSSILANYILKKFNYSEKIVDILIKIMSNADASNLNKSNDQLMISLVSFSNIRMVLTNTGKNLASHLVKYYENIKNLKFNREIHTSGYNMR